MTTVLRPKPNPRAMLTTTSVVTVCGPSSASAGPPSSNVPATKTGRLPYRRSSRGEANSARTVASMSEPASRPAAALVAPAEIAYIGVTDSRR